MNEYVENAKKIVTTTARKVIKKSGDIYSTTKLSLQISKFKGEIDDCYEKIGKMFYENYCGESQSGGDVEALCKKIDELKENIEVISAQISEIKDVAICKSCGAEVKKDDPYCAKCGKEI